MCCLCLNNAINQFYLLQASTEGKILRDGYVDGFVSSCREILLNFLNNHFPVEIEFEVPTPVKSYDSWSMRARELLLQYTNQLDLCDRYVPLLPLHPSHPPSTPPSHPPLPLTLSSLSPSLSLYADISLCRRVSTCSSAISNLCLLPQCSGLADRQARRTHTSSGDDGSSGPDSSP